MGGWGRREEAKAASIMITRRRTHTHPPIHPTTTTDPRGSDGVLLAAGWRDGDGPENVRPQVLCWCGCKPSTHTHSFIHARVHPSTPFTLSPFLLDHAHAPLHPIQSTHPPHPLNPTPNTHSKKLVSLAAEKLVSEIVHDTTTYSRMKEQDGETLKLEDLKESLSKYGIQKLASTTEEEGGDEEASRGAAEGGGGGGGGGRRPSSRTR